MNLHDGHRKRVDKKVIEQGLEMLEVHEQLEHLLFAVIPRGDTNKIAHRLLDRFVTVGGVLNADVKELVKVEGVGERTAMFLHSLPALLGIVERNLAAHELPSLRSVKEIVDFARTYFYGKVVEEAYIFSLNASYRLIAVSKISDGIGGQTYIFPAKVIKRAISDNASIVVIAHNHPGGIINPSVNDFEVTRSLAEILAEVNITLFDSIVVSGKEYFSLREKGYLEPISKKYK